MKTAPTTGTATDGAAARLALTRYEAATCARLPSSDRQRDFRAGRLAARRAVMGFVGRGPSRSMEVRSGVDGFPSLSLLDPSGRWRTTSVELSISHRDGRAVAAIARAGVRVGVDLERVGAVPRRLAGHFLTPQELDLAGAGDPTVLWSLKEAAWKALALGRSLPLKALELCCDDAGGLRGGLRGVRVRGVFVPMHSRMSTPWPGYHMAMVWTTGGVA